MKIAIAFLDYKRHQHTKQALQSIAKAGYPFDLFTINQKGISKAINLGIDIVYQNGYDALITCANDIEMPDNWLHEMVINAHNIDISGMIGIHCVQDWGEKLIVNELPIHLVACPFGNALITKKAIDAVVYFNEVYDPYGMQDSDYGYRLIKTGFTNYYIDGMESKHIGHDVGQKTEYRLMKDEGLAKAREIWNKTIKGYLETENYYI